MMKLRYMKGVLVLARIGLVLNLVAGTELRFGFSMRIMLITQCLVVAK